MASKNSTRNWWNMKRFLFVKKEEELNAKNIEISFSAAEFFPIS